MGHKRNTAKREANGTLAAAAKKGMEAPLEEKPEPLKVTDQTKAMASVGESKKEKAFVSRYGAMIKLLKEPGDEKIATQVRGILACLKANGGQMTQVQLAAKLKADGHIQTVQEPLRIYTFYRKFMLDRGYITCVAS